MTPPTAERARAQQQEAKRRAEELERERDRANDVPAAVGNRATAEVAKAEPRSGGWLRGRILFELEQGQKGFAVRGWKIEPSGPEALDPEQQRLLDAVVAEAVFESSSRWSHAFAGTIDARTVAVPVTLPYSDLATERSRSLLASRIGDHLRGAIRSTRDVEDLKRQQRRDRLRYAPVGSLTVEQELARETALLREEIARMRREIGLGIAEQSQAKSTLGRLSALAATSPEPDINAWRDAETYIRMAEDALAAEDPRGADMFMDVARAALRSQQEWWARYKQSYALGDEVLKPVFWTAFSLMSLGVVDEELFDISEEAARKGVGNQLLTVGVVVLERVGNLVTFGAYEGWKHGVERRIEEAPDDPLWEVMLLAGEDAVQGVIDTMLPLQELATMAGAPTVNAEGQTVEPDVWVKLGAFFGAVLKMAVLGGMVRGKGKGKGKGKGGDQGKGEQGKSGEQGKGEQGKTGEGGGAGEKAPVERPTLEQKGDAATAEPQKLGEQQQKVSLEPKEQPPVAQPKAKSKPKPKAKKKPASRKKQTREEKLRKHLEKQLERDKPLKKPRDYFEEDSTGRKPTAEEVARDPTTGEIIERAEEPQGTFKGDEATTIGQLEELPELREWIPKLKEQGFEKTHTQKGGFRGAEWLLKIFQKGRRPDSVSFDPVRKRILIGDITSRFQNLIPEEFGSGMRLHIEKTLDYARLLVSELTHNPKLSEGFGDFTGWEVFAAERYRDGTQTKLIKVGKIGKAVK